MVHDIAAARGGTAGSRRPVIRPVITAAMATSPQCSPVYAASSHSSSSSPLSAASAGMTATRRLGSAAPVQEQLLQNVPFGQWEVPFPSRYSDNENSVTMNINIYFVCYVSSCDQYSTFAQVNTFFLYNSLREITFLQPLDIVLVLLINVYMCGHQSFKSGTYQCHLSIEKCASTCTSFRSKRRNTITWYKSTGG